MTEDSATDPATRVRQAQQRLLLGVGLVTIGCVFGGLLAIVLNLLGLRPAAGAAAIGGGLVVIAGVVMQVMSYRQMQAIKRSGS